MPRLLAHTGCGSTCVCACVCACACVCVRVYVRVHVRAREQARLSNDMSGLLATTRPRSPTEGDAIHTPIADSAHATASIQRRWSELLRAPLIDRRACKRSRTSRGDTSPHLTKKRKNFKNLKNNKARNLCTISNDSSVCQYETALAFPCSLEHSSAHA